mmetsp:Transcript_46050/g.106324  ORF Transcript_46050/g.106324 Transcript_46050/m.106324 type:complete len:109 (-) Transcript_46050:184-510(-)
MPAIPRPWSTSSATMTWTSSGRTGWTALPPRPQESVRTFRDQLVEVQLKVIGEGFLTGANKSVVLMSRIRRVVESALCLSTLASTRAPLFGRAGQALREQPQAFDFVQ